jgi:serine/threonine-protein kinase
VLSDRYRLDDPIASGGMGEVWRATDTSLGRDVAVKVLRSALHTDPSFDARFRAEARMMAVLTHPNVVNIYDYGHSPLGDGTEVAYLVMAYVAGEPLSQRIATAGRLPVSEALAIVAQAADALHAAHSGGIIHRDVKPANLLVQPNGTVILVDFGVARSPSVTGVTTVDGVLGTAMYMSPEQASGVPVTPATDIYALGAVAYHCLAGDPPFTGSSALGIALKQISEEPPPLPDDIPPAVRALTAQALAKDPGQRYPSAAAFAAAARAAMTGRGATRATASPAFAAAVAATPGSVAGGAAAAGLPGPAPGRPGGAGRPGGRPRRDHFTAALVGSAAVALLLGALGLAAVLGSAQPGASTPVDRPAAPATATPTQGKTTPPAPGGAIPAGVPAGDPSTTAPPSTPPGTPPPAQPMPTRPAPATGSPEAPMTTSPATPSPPSTAPAPGQSGPPAATTTPPPPTGTPSAQAMAAPEATPTATPSSSAPVSPAPVSQ